MQIKKEIEISNLRVLQCYGGMCAVLFFAYMLEFFKGARTLGYLFLFSCFLIVPYVITILIYIKQKSSYKIKELMLIGYSVFYSFILYTTENLFTSVFIIPMMIITQMYQDKKFSFRIGISAVLINVVSICVNLFYLKKVSPVDIQNYEIQFAVTVIVAVYNTISTAVLVQKEKVKIDIIAEERDRGTAIVEQSKSSIVNITKVMHRVKEVTEDISINGKKSNASIESILDETFDLLDVVQVQIDMTQEITKATEEAKASFENIHASFEEASAVTTDGMDKMQYVKGRTDNNKRIGNDVVACMEGLLGHANQAKTILGMIEGITKQTHLLSLNASIEAARVGEYGKGFAVVADEIQKLARQTSEATTQISGLLNQLNDQIVLASRNVGNLVEANNEQFQLAEEMLFLFENLQGGMESSSSDMEIQANHIDGIVNSNHSINEGIEQIGSFTEKLWGETESTKKTAEKAINGVIEIHQLIDDVVMEMESLKRLVVVEA